MGTDEEWGSKRSASVEVETVDGFPMARKKPRYDGDARVGGVNNGVFWYDDGGNIVTWKSSLSRVVFDNEFTLPKLGVTLKERPIGVYM